VMHLPEHLIRSIETTHVAFEGLSHPLRVISIDPEPTGKEPHAALITVETTHNGETRRASCAIAPPVLDDERQVVTTLAECMREVLCGDRPEGDGSH
jgi:hypothetical protein